MSALVDIPISLTPVLAFLAALIFMDSFKLVSLRAVLRTLLFGTLAAAASYGLNVWIIGDLGLSPLMLQRYAAPIGEELLKGACIVYLIKTARVGFLVDAAIHGFAVGTGFAVVENLHYLHVLDTAGIFLWIVRGFGTATMHGATTAIFAIISKQLTERKSSPGLSAFLPGIGVAVVIHSLFNHLLINPLAMTAIILIAMPVMVIYVFQRSESATRQWLDVGFDTDVELLELIASDQMAESRIGRYLHSLKTRFPGKIVGDMLCLLQVHLELSARAKGILLAHEAGIDLEIDESIRDSLEDLKFLEKSLGKTGRLAIKPILNRSNRDLWQLNMLGKK